MTQPTQQSARSEGLLPATPEDNDDGRMEVAEEVNLDQQSDSARKVGQLPENVEDALADALAPGKPEPPR